MVIVTFVIVTQLSGKEGLVVVWTISLAPTVPPMFINRSPFDAVIVRNGGTPQKLAPEFVGAPLMPVTPPPFPDMRVLCEVPLVEATKTGCKRGLFVAHTSLEKGPGVPLLQKDCAAK